MALARFEVFVAGQRPEVAVRYRDAIVNSLMIASERNCGIYLSNLRGWQVAHRSTLGLLEIAVDTAGALTTNADTSRLFSGLSGVATATSGRIDAEVFAATAVELIAAQVTSAMDTERAAIRLKLGSAYSGWDLGAAVADMERMHQQCDVRVGLARLRQNNALDTASAEVLRARGIVSASATANRAALLSGQAESFEDEAARLDADKLDLEQQIDAAPERDRPSLRRRVADLQRQADSARRRAQEFRTQAAALREADGATEEPAGQTPS
jgi:hypothetical protein